VKVGKRELERIIIKKKTGGFIAEINDDKIEIESDVAVELIGIFPHVEALVGECKTSFMLHGEKVWREK